MQLPSFSTFKDLEKFLNILTSSFNNCDNVNMLIDLRPLHMWALTLAKECFVEWPYLSRYHKQIVHALCDFLRSTHRAFLSLYLECIKNSLKFSRIYTHSALLEMLTALDDVVLSEYSSPELDKLLYELLDTYIVLVVLFLSYDNSLLKIIFVIAKILSKRIHDHIDSDQLALWCEFFEKISSVKIICKLIDNTVQKKINNIECYEDQLFLFILSTGLKGYREDNRESKCNFYYIMAQKTFMKCLQILGLSKRSFYSAFHKSIWSDIILYYQVNEFTMLNNYFNYIFGMFQASFKFSFRFINERILPAIVLKHDLSIPTNFMLSLRTPRSQSDDIHKLIEEAFSPIIIELFFKYNADLEFILLTVERFEQITGLFSVLEQFKNIHSRQNLFQRIIMKFAENPGAALRALSFIHTINGLPSVTNLKDNHLGFFLNPKKFTSFLNDKAGEWLDKLNIFHERASQRVCLILFHILRFVDKQRFIQHNMFELLSILRIVIRSQNISKEHLIYVAHILKLIVKYYPINDLKSEASIMSRLAWSLYADCKSISQEIYKLLLALDDDTSTEILNTIVLLPYEDELKNRIQRHIKLNGYEYNPFEIDCRNNDQTMDSIDSKHFHNICKYMIYLSMQFDNEDERIQTTALGKFYNILEDNMFIFANITNYRHRSKDLEKDTNFNLKFPFPKNFNLDKLWKFFRFIILQLLKTIKYTKCDNLAASALGLIGAVNSQNFRLNRPFLKDNYREDLHKDYFTELLEFSNISVFRPQTFMFKKVFLKIVLRRIFFTNQCSFHDVCYSTRKLYKLFQTPKRVTVFGNDIYVDGSTHTFSSQKINDYCKIHYSKDKREEMRAMMISTLTYEKNEHLDNVSIFEPHELKFLSKSTGFESLSLKQNHKRIYNAQQFFSNIDANMSYEKFILDFITMIYQEYIFAPKTSKDISISPNVIFSQVYTQLSQRAEQRASVNEVTDKLKSLDIPSEMYELSYLFAIQDIQLAHLLLPSLIVHALSQVSEERQIEFADYFSNMIRKDFLEHHSMFSGELGVMASQFLCFLFDFFHDFLYNRKRLHEVLIKESYVRSKASKYDAAFCALNHILVRINYLDMARLCLRLKSFTRALYYFEKFFESNRSQQSSSRDIYETLSNNELMLLLEIFYQLEDKQSLRGMNLKMKYFPDMLQKFFFSANNVEKSSQMVLAQDILNLPNLSMSQRYLIQEFLAKNFSSRCFGPNGFAAFSKHVFEQLSNDDNPNSICSPEVPSLICDAALDLNSWDILEEAFSSPKVQPFIQNRISKVIKHLYDGESVDNISEELRKIEKFYIQPLKSELLNNHFNAFEHAYRSIVYLHSIYDIHSFVNVPYVNIFDSNQDLDSIIRSFEETTHHWGFRNKIVSYVYELNQNKFDLKQQIVRVQMMLVKVFKALMEKRFRNKDNILEPLFSKHNFLLFSELMRASIEQDNIEDAYHYFLSAYSSRSQFYLQAQPGVCIQESTTETYFIIEASNILYKQNNKEGALDLVRKELAERYSDLNKQLTNEVFSKIEENESDYNKINEIALELNLQLPDRLGMLFNVWRTSKSNDENARKRLNLKAVRSLESNEFVDYLSQLKRSVIENYELLKLQYMVLAEESGALSLQAMKFCSDQINILTQHNPLSQSRNHLHMALYNWRYIVSQEERKIRLSKEERLQNYKLREDILTSILYSLKITENHFQVAVPILISNLKSMSMNEHFKAECQLPDKRIYITTFENCCQQLIDFADNGPVAVYINYVESLATAIMSASKSLFYKTVQHILVVLTRKFPYHMNWNLQRFTDLFYKDFFHVSDIFNDAKKYGGGDAPYDIEKIRQQFTKSVQVLSDFCETKLPSQSRRSSKLLLSDHAQRLWFHFSKTCKESSIVLPFSSFLNIGLYNLLEIHNIDNFHHLFIDSLENEFRMMVSIQCPKVIQFRCKDGMVRPILLKNGDDLRRDRLFMDFARLANQAQNGELSIFQPLKMYALSGRSEKKRSSIRFYSIVPLSRLAGIIEWVPNLVSFNNIILQEKEYLGQFHAYRNLQAGFEAKVRNMSSVENRMKAYSQIVENTPPVFQNWFINHFANAHSWYTARKNYILSTAAYSVIGFIMGLGDRHGENIQFDNTSGACVHIDFNCIFNHGESFLVPELVPFRLTQNMRAAMGVTKHCGEFSGEFEDLLTTLREYKNFIMTVFLPLQCDPLYEWRENCKKSDTYSTKLMEFTLQQIYGVKARLSGHCKRKQGHHYGSAISPGAQTNYLINQAIDEKNLSLMFYGWRAYN